MSTHIAGHEGVGRVIQGTPKRVKIKPRAELRETITDSELWSSVGSGVTDISLNSRVGVT